MALTRNWWKTSTFYQIWPASYKDGNGDGMGDIPGIIEKLPYVKDLGVDAIWLSPMYDSPQKDYGYDVSNYEDIYAPFGTLQDMEEMIRKCHELGLKLILDLVLNHTSDEHAWFKESRSSRTNPKADWYIWKDPKIVNGKRLPPTNWECCFGGSTWEYARERDQYYFHSFLAGQPDINWEVEAARRAVYKSAIEFWLDRGIDGFRVDAVNFCGKDTGFPDARIALPNQQFQPAFQHMVNGPRIHEWLHEQRTQVLDNYGDVFIVGELHPTPTEEKLKYISAERREINCLFDLEIVSIGNDFDAGVRKHQIRKPALPPFKDLWRESQTMVDMHNTWITAVVESHDQPRCLSRFATDDPKYREKAAKMFATFLCCLTGTLFIYQGQEIGMVNFPKSWDASELRDVDALTIYKTMAEKYDNDPRWCRKALDGLQYLGRDNARLPVQWDSSPNAGFTTGKPWIRVHDNYESLNVAAQQQDNNSPLNFWRRMLKVRKEYADLMTFGKFEVWDRNDLDTFSFTKSWGKNSGDKPSTEKEQKLVVFLNFSNDEQPISWPTDCKGKDAKLIVSNVDKPEGFLTPWESQVWLVTV